MVKPLQAAPSGADLSVARNILTTDLHGLNRIEHFVTLKKHGVPERIGPFEGGENLHMVEDIVPEGDDVALEGLVRAQTLGMENVRNARNEIVFSYLAL